MKRPSPHVPTTRSADDHRTRKHRTIPRGRDVVGKHVVAGRDEVDELHLAHRTHPHVCRTRRGSNYRGLSDGRVDHALLSVLSHQTFGDLERPTVSPDVLAEAEDVLVALHLFEETFANRLEVGDLRHRACPSSTVARELLPPT